MRKILYNRTDHMAHAHCMLIMTTTNTLRICKSYCLSSATVVARMRLNVTLYVHWLSFHTKHQHQCGRPDGVVGVGFTAEKNLFILLQNIHNVSAAHPTSYVMGTWASVPGGKAAVSVNLSTHHHPEPRLIMDVNLHGGHRHNF